MGILIGTNPWCRAFYAYLFTFEKPINSLRTSSPSPRIAFNAANFSDLEIAFLVYLLHAENTDELVKTPDLQAVIYPMTTNPQRARIVRNNFIKNLNLKLYMMYGVSEGITRKGTEEDKRKKCYLFHENLIQLGIMADIQQNLYTVAH